MEKIGDPVDSVCITLLFIFSFVLPISVLPTLNFWLLVKREIVTIELYIYKVRSATPLKGELNPKIKFTLFERTLKIRE